ncbi:hypothetical protein JG687_00015911 [Phytophthora cactorum]|uniref:Glycosyltransferase family 28 N-terminal domain-containing protein n=1 Tax=Phytophthora cactorum TaxID=29920 RepID=A0A8T1TUN8_9STRA|nr:hypothetical protein JG687_00015911 [Phytophthora cactorum]
MKKATPKQRIADKSRQSIGKLSSFANAVKAAVIFDRVGRIPVDFDDDSKYRSSGLKERAKKRDELIRKNKSRFGLDVPTLSICIMVVGTHGDVQPFVAIAKRLIQDGHRVRLTTHAIYRDFVMNHGIEFYPLTGDPKVLSTYMVKTGGHLIHLNLEAIQKDIPRNMQMIEEILHSTWPAVSSADPDGGGPGVPGKPFQRQAIISNPVTYGHIHVAERLGVPLHIMFPQPWVPTTAFPHPLSNMPYTGKPKNVNYMTYKLVDLLMWQGTEAMVNTFRTDVLNLRKIRKGDGVTLEGSGSIYTPTPELEDFLEHGDDPIFVGFGSMILQDPKFVTKMIIEAAEQANVRVLIQSSWSDMAGDIDVPDSVFFFGSCPHDWLMTGSCRVYQRWYTTVEQAPQQRVFSLASQRSSYHSSETKHSGVVPSWTLVSVQPLSFTNVHPNSETSCGKKMVLARPQKDKLRMCNERAYVVASRPESSPTDIVEYTYMDYSAQGPDSVFEDASSGVGAMAHVLRSGVKDVFVKPARGYREKGANGAVVGLVKGVGGFMVSPVLGAIVLADHAATGAYNNFREEGEKKKGSIIKGNNNIMSALGFNSRDVHTGSMSADGVADGGRPLSRQVVIDLTQAAKSRLERRLDELGVGREILEGGDVAEVDLARITFIGSDTLGMEFGDLDTGSPTAGTFKLAAGAKRLAPLSSALDALDASGHV